MKLIEILANRMAVCTPLFLALPAVALPPLRQPRDGEAESEEKGCLNGTTIQLKAILV
jgi:hypothetical protein